MTDDAGEEGTWVTGVIGEPFRVDKDGHPIPGSESQGPTEEPDPEAVRKAFDEAMGWGGAGDKAPSGGGLGDLLPTGILPDRGPQMIGGGDDETQKEIWDQMERGEFGSNAGSIPEDAETTI